MTQPVEHAACLTSNGVSIESLGAYKRGDSAMIIDSARRGIYIGFPLLQAWEMAFDERNALLRGVKPFPHMVKWIRG